MAEGSFSLTDETVQVPERGNGNFEKKPAKVFRPEAGKTYRINFTSGEVTMRLRHYNPFEKKYYRCLSYQGFCPICLAASNKVNKQIKRASETYGANLRVYDLNPDGSLKEPVNAEIYFWAFGSDKFVQLRNIIKEWGPITNIDLMVTCTDAQFQKVSFTPARECKYLTSGDQFKQQCDAKYETDKYPLEKFICREASVVDLVTKFQLDGSYVPDHIRAQMGEGQQTAQDMAGGQQYAPQNQQYPPQNQQYAPQNQQYPPQGGQYQNPPQNQQYPPQGQGYAQQQYQNPPQQPAQQPAPQPPAGNFADLNSIQNLL